MALSRKFYVLKDCLSCLGLSCVFLCRASICGSDDFMSVLAKRAQCTLKFIAIDAPGAPGT